MLIKLAFSGLQGAGKTFLASKLNDKLPENSVQMLKVADPIYNIATSFYQNLEWEWKKDRELLQHIGTNLGRKLYGKDIWIRYLLTKIDKTKHVIIDDVRFKNEVKMLKKAGFAIVRVIRQKKYTTRTNIFHRSELELLAREWVDRCLFKMFKKTYFFDFLYYN